MTRRLARLGLFAPLLTAAAGAIALALWITGNWQILTRGPNYIPMAPVTATVFLLLGLALSARGLRPQSNGAQRAETAVGVFSVGIAAVELLTPLLGASTPWRAILFPAEVSGFAFPMGRMSPLTAASFLLVGAAVLSARRPEAWKRWIAVLCGIATLLIALIVLAGYAAGAPLDYGGGRVPMALLTASTMVFLSLSLLLDQSTLEMIRTHMGLDRETTGLEAERPFALRLGALTLGLAILIVTTAILYTRTELAQARASVWRELDSVATLKARELEQWREERLAEGRFLSSTAQISEDIRAFLATPGDRAARQRVINWLDPIRGRDRYESAEVFDAQGRLRLSIPDKAPAGPVAIEPAQPGEVVTLGAIDLDPTGRPHLDLRAPIGGVEPVGLVLLSVDPRRHLFPMLERWPVPSSSAEAVLVRREGNEVVFLHDVRHRPDTALKLRFPLDSPFLPSARAARGELGTREGVDYRSEPVISSARAIPGSSWILVAKVDQAEVYAPIRADAARAVVIVVALLLAVALAAAYLLRERHALALQRGLVAERDRSALAERLALVTQHANDIILVLSEEGQILEANERAAAAYGYTVAELLSMSTVKLRADGDPAALTERLREMVEDRGVRFESRHRRKDGSTFDVEISGRAVVSEGRRVIMAIHRDVSERKAHEAQVKRLSRLYAALSQVNQAIVRATTVEGLLSDVCRGLVEAGRFRMAWLGEVEPSTNEIRAIARHGDTEGYLAGLRITINDEPAGRGPTGTAIRENRAQVCDDVMTDPRMSQWREAAMRAGYRSSIGLPLTLPGGRRGVLTVYAGEPGFFKEEEIALLEEAAVDTAFGLANLDREARRLQAEQSLRTSEARYHSTLDSIMEGCQIIGVDWRILYLNHAVERQNRRPNSELLGRTIMDCWPGVEETTLFRILTRCMNERIPVREEIQFTFPDGGNAWFEVHCQPVPEGLFLMSMDITEIREARQALSLSEESLRTVSMAVEQSPVSIVVTDLRGNIEYVNPHFARVTGYSRDEIIGQNPRLLQSGQVPASVYSEMWRRLKAGEVWEGEFHNRKKDGELFWEHATISPIRDARGEIKSYVGVKEDITERRRAEERMAAQVAELLRWQAAMRGREGRVQELKREVNELSRRLGHPAPYPSQDTTAGSTPAIA